MLFSLIIFLVFFLDECYVLCLKKKYNFLLKENNTIYHQRQRECTNKSYLSLKKHKKNYYCKNEKKRLILYNKEGPKDEYKVDIEKKILGHNLFNFSLEDILTIFKLLLYLKKIILYRHNNNISIQIKEPLREDDSSYHDTIYEYGLFLKKYLSKNKNERNTFFNIFDTKLIKTGDICCDAVEKNQQAQTVTLGSNDQLENNDTDYFMEKGRDMKEDKTNISNIIRIFKKIIKKLHIDLKEERYINKINDKTILIVFYVNGKKFGISCCYKKIDGTYYLYKNTVYVEVCDTIKKDIAIINLISNNRLFCDFSKDKISVNPFYIKYYVKYYLNTLFHISPKLVINNYSSMIYNNKFPYISQIGNPHNNLDKNTMHTFFLNDKNSIDIKQAQNCENKHNDAIRNYEHIKKKNKINVKVIRIYMNGKYYVSIPMCLIYNVIKKKFYINNILYIDNTKHNLEDICTLMGIYFNNINFFQNNNFIYLNNTNIILNSDQLNFDLNYILLFYFAYFNNKKKLHTPKEINPLFPFYNIMHNKKGNNSKIIKKVVYRSDSNFVNFVY
ncbi:conserved Plasmodium protein, unknown function [Plasmodium chabaudi chabaudi]|uniref:Uncharacterized protein n=1 Tax=Plasmodium chabaudi chabaudi TaxID=31271 RepID=A0A4V6M9F6_PLACU|nr:conserved Plasmodium protein, unknown function [Plasmodium chabaudi chabaudi]VTZ69264.1 conserved Plasmodium protein, unknown function [Plasmodium chabaudi chabaudi]|eukprot:XP_739234.2 conserved Plasmodium protein, unknown function [Plasmodium chabaudi chabaudi]